MQFKNDKFEQGLILLSAWDNVPPLHFIKTHTWFDYMVGGLLEGSVTVIAGASGDGKSLASLHLAYALAKTFKRDDEAILFVSCENDSRVDFQRKNEAEKFYGYNGDKILYWNALDNDGTKNTANKMINFNTIIDNIKEGLYKIVIIDALQNMIPPRDEGGSMKVQGDALMDQLVNAAKLSNTTVIVTWQLGRGAKSIDIEDYTVDLLSLSIGVARYASHIYAVKRQKAKKGQKNGSYWKMRIIKSRTGFNTEEDSIDLEVMKKFGFQEILTCENK